jgi:hypothetical protein
MTQPATFFQADRLIKQSLFDAGRLNAGATPSDTLFDDCLQRLTDLVAYYQTKGCKLWLNALQSITLVAGTKSYSLGPSGAIIAEKPLRVLEGWYVITSNGSRRPLDPLSWNTYYGLGNVTAQGEVTGYFVDKQREDLIVHLWSNPSTSAAANGTVELLIQRFYSGPTEITEQVLFPPEWYLALRWGLADELATTAPPALAQRAAIRARELLAELEAWDVEDAPVRFTVGHNSQAGFPSRFNR